MFHYDQRLDGVGILYLFYSHSTGCWSVTNFISRYYWSSLTKPFLALESHIYRTTSLSDSCCSLPQQLYLSEQSFLKLRYHPTNEKNKQLPIPLFSPLWPTPWEVACSRRGRRSPHFCHSSQWAKQKCSGGHFYGIWWKWSCKVMEWLWRVLLVWTV